MPQNTDNQSDSARCYRVLMIAPTSFFADYGCHVRILEEARTLKKMGHLVTIVTYRNGKDVPGLKIERTLPIPWRRDYEVGSSRHKIVFDLLLGLKLLQLLLFQRYDVIHAHLHEGALIGLILGRLFRLPVLFDFQGSLTEEMIDHHFLTRTSRFYKLLHRLEQWIDRSAGAIFTSSVNAERLLIEQFACDPNRICALPDCVDADVFKPAADYDPAALAQLRQQLGLPATAKVIVYLGLLAEYQGTSLLLSAMQRILQTQPDVYLLLMGFPGVDLYRQQAMALDIAHRVIFTGRIPYPEAPKYLALGTVAVAPKLSVSEGAGKLLNYMALALPTVAFDTPVAREYLGANGLFARRGNVESLADKLQAGLALSLEAPTTGEQTLGEQTLGQRLRQRAIQQFEWKKAGQTIVEAYEKLVTKAGEKSLKRAWVVTQK